MSIDVPRVKAAVREYLAAIGIDPDDSRFTRTPNRVAQAAQELFAGIGVDAVTPLVEGRICLEDSSLSPEHAETGAKTGTAKAVLLRNIRFRSICEHHLLPYDGWIQLAYLPGDSIIGFSRLYTLVETLCSRPTLQEYLGEELADVLMLGLGAQGAVVVIEARQGCVSDRGIRQSDSETVTLATRGAYNDPDARAEVLRLIVLGGNDREPDD